MGIFTGFLMAVMLWWIIFLAILPLRSQPGRNYQKGLVPSSPQKTYMREKILLTSLLTVLIMIGLYFFVKYKVIALDNL